MDKRKSRVIKNLLFSFISKFLMFGIGIFIPKLIIDGYGSEINGLLASIGNVFSYLSLIMAGVGIAAIQGLYSPVAKGDWEEVSSILTASRNYFINLLKWYVGAFCIFAILYPFIVKTSLSKILIFTIIMIQGCSAFLTYRYSMTLQALLSADGKDYIAQIISFFVFIINSLFKIALILLDIHIVILELVYLIVNIIQILLFYWYVKYSYPTICWNQEPDYTCLSKRKNFLLNGIAWTVFNATPTVIISILCGFLYSSIYALYNMVFSSMNIIFSICFNSVIFVLGQVYHEDKKKYLILHDGLEAYICSFIFASLSVAYILIIPFFRLYTRSFHEASYIDPVLPLLFCLLQIFSNTRLISGNLINITNNPQLTNTASILEVGANIILSIAITYSIGFHGVLIGAVIPLFFKNNFIILISNLKILKRIPIQTYFTHCLNLFLFLLVICYNYYFPWINIDSYVLLLKKAVLISIEIFALFFTFNILCCKSSRLILGEFYKSFLLYRSHKVQ